MSTQLKNVHVHYGGVKALDGVDIANDEGEIVALMGRNGGGEIYDTESYFGFGADLWRLYCGTIRRLRLAYKNVGDGYRFRASRQKSFPSSLYYTGKFGLGVSP